MPSSVPPGRFAAVGIGPGAPDLLTLRAAKAVETCDILLAPRSTRSDESLALAAVRPFLGRAEVVECTYPMERDDQKTREYWNGIADRTAAWCNEGKTVAQITLGDPLIYSTSGYLLEALADRLPADRISVIPGISAFQAAAGRFGEPICLQEDRVLLMTATDLGAVEEALDRCETLVLYKAGRRLRELADLLDRRGLLDRARAACYVEQEGKELLCTDLRELAGRPQGYMATLILRLGRRAW